MIFIKSNIIKKLVNNNTMQTKKMNAEPLFVYIFTTVDVACAVVLFCFFVFASLFLLSFLL